jgi:hypothetical protein
MHASKPPLHEIAAQFQLDGYVTEIEPYGSGHINHTYRLQCRLPDGGVRRYILQRINQNVFKSPETLMHNMVLVTTYLRDKVEASGGESSRRVLTLIPTGGGAYFYRTPDGDFWRAETFIEGAQTYLQAQNSAHYYQVALAFGKFLRHLHDFPLGQLHPTIPDFHHTPKRFDAFVRATENDAFNRAHSVIAEIDFIFQRATETTHLVDLVTAGQMPERVTHNDTKLDNVMIDDSTGEGICVIDLDTVMPGLAVFDFGDAVRSCCNPVLEDELDLSRVNFDLRTFRLLAQGFLDATRDCLTPIEIANLAFGAKLITLEQGLRFLGDYLNGDMYYKIHWPEQNLARARTQLKLVLDMEMVFDEMQQTVGDCAEGKSPSEK